MANGTPNSPEIQAAFADYDRHETISNFKVACVIGMALMPAGFVLDSFFYSSDPATIHTFLKLRLECSLLIALFLALLLTPLGHRHYRFHGVTLFMLPASFIAWMIYSKEGMASPYYAGLNLVLLVLAYVLHWTFRESLVAASLVIALYLGACFAPHPAHVKNLGMFVNNLYFLVLTGMITVTGSYFHSKARFREFALRFELDRNRKALQETNQKLMELDQIKSRFFANISHELRTPLTLLLAPLETLQHRFAQALDGEAREMLGTMHANGMRLLKLINDLLDLVRLESGRMEVKREPLPVAEFLKGLASAARQVADDKRLRLETFVDPALETVLADRDKLEKILLNLVFNALKFTPAGGRVELRAEKRAEELVLIVADTGMGISEKNLPYVFDRFWQADGTSKRKYQGVGIGLALVKELVEVQGGKVTVQSQEGKGTTFTVALPCQKAEPAQAPKPEAAAESAESGGTVTSEEWLANLYRRAELFPALTPVQESLRPVEASGNGALPMILVADDEPDMLRFLKTHLSRHFRVLEAVDGQQAIEKASQFLPDIILLDMMMPEKDGLQACREIRDHTPTESIPVVLLTARADDETKLAALSAGASDFLKKPFSTIELDVRLRNLVELNQYQRKVSKQKQQLESTLERLKETETQLVQTEKLASLGRMSAGIIHEINNPLNNMTMGLKVLHKKGQYVVADKQEEYSHLLKDVEQELKRVNTIVSDLRVFAHPGSEGRDQVEVPEVVGRVLRLLNAEWDGKVRIEQNLAEQQTVWANKNRLIQLLLNLLHNSLDALKTKSFEQEQPTIWIEGRLEPGRSILVVRDNGPGIAAEHLKRIFDPFYTTKDVGEGMGLGLAICHRIVQDCEGRISVRTEAGQFCEFTLEFPAKGQEQTEA
jgi:signal transduction histidine kinase